MKMLYRCALIAATFLFLLAGGQCMAASSDNKYLDGNRNFPFTYGHAGYFEYLDLNGCAVVSHSGGITEFIAPWVSVGGEYYRQRRQGTRRFRLKDTEPFPEFYDERSGQWVSLPPQLGRNEAQRMVKSMGYADYIRNYHLFEDAMFRLAYKKLFGKAYGGTVPIPGFSGPDAVVYADLSSAVQQPSRIGEIIVAVCVKKADQRGNVLEEGVWYFRVWDMGRGAEVKTSSSTDYVFYYGAKNFTAERDDFAWRLVYAAKENGKG